MSLLEKYLAKAEQEVERKTEVVLIDGDEWSVRSLTFEEERKCYKLAEDKEGNFDGFRYNDVRLVKCTEHAFPWNHPELLKKYRAADKYELPVKLFNDNRAAYRELLAAVRRVNADIKTEAETMDELKN
ncbi:hypothetical protein [Aneurinibacillus thermoaerophilus]|uniref:hypothetical protein n=1 Tax=Aneurinibacillus thermoaerophilus TaxID=143495 RepID=UPI002E1BC6E6|nr:hypothetical protein [Aneurinibacillus thermoaerophilus]